MLRRVQESTNKLSDKKTKRFYETQDVQSQDFHDQISVRTWWAEREKESELQSTECDAGGAGGTDKYTVPLFISCTQRKIALSAKVQTLSFALL